MRRLALLGVSFTLWSAAALAQSGQVVEYYHTDALGSVRVVTTMVNGQRQEVARHDYMPFGEEVAPASPPVQTRLFTGKERDAETGLDYFGARYLATTHARFTTVDPLAVSGEPTTPSAGTGTPTPSTVPCASKIPSGARRRSTTTARATG